MPRVVHRLLAAVVVAGSVAAAAQAPTESSARAAEHAPPLQSTAAVLWQPSMNVFRRFDAPAEKMFEFLFARSLFRRSAPGRTLG